MVGMTADDDELTRLRGENARLIGLLDDHGIAWHGPEPVPVSATRYPQTKRSRSCAGCFVAAGMSIQCAGRARRARPAIARVCQRMARRYLRASAHQVLRLRQPAVGTTD